MSRAPSGPPELGLRQTERERERDEPLLRAVVEVALQAAALGVLRLQEADPRGPDLLEVALALGDVHAAQELFRPTVEPDEWAGRPVDRAALARPGDEPGREVVDLARRDARLEPRAHFSDVFGCDHELPEEAPAGRRVVVARHVLEGRIDAFPGDAAVGLGDEEDVRRRPRDHAEQVALPHELLPALLALGDVECGDDPPVQALAVDDVVDRAVHDQLVARFRAPAALELLREAARHDALEGGVEHGRVLRVEEDLRDEAPPNPLVVRVARQAFGSVVEADDRALLVAEHERDRRGVDDRASERLLVLDLTQPLRELALELVRRRDVPDDGHDLVPARRGHPRLEETALAVDVELVLERLRALTRECPLRAGHDPVDHVLGQEVADVLPDHLLAHADEAARVAGDVLVRAVAREPDHQVRDRVEQRQQPGLALPERVEARVLLGHRRSAAMRAPESSPLGTKPLAPLSSTSVP